MSFMAQREGERDRNNCCPGTAGGSKDDKAMCDLISQSQELEYSDCLLKAFGHFP